MKEHEGEYRCVANNTIDPPAFVNFYIEILRELNRPREVLQLIRGNYIGVIALKTVYPEITIEKNWAHSALGEKVDLTCHVSANPIAKVYFKIIRQKKKNVIE